MLRNIACAAIAAVTVVVVGLLLTRKTPPLHYDATTAKDAAPTTPVYPRQIGPSAPKRTMPDAERQAWRARLRARRATQLENLRSYALAGLYPRNTDTPGQRSPVFVDDRDTACAVGHMMRASGRDELVDTIRRADNHIRIDDIRSGPAMDWILTSGFTQEECARIQPEYNFRRRQAKQPDPVVQSRLLEVYDELVARNDASLQIAYTRIEWRYETQGPIPEDCLGDVQVIVLPHDAKVDALIRK